MATTTVHDDCEVGFEEGMLCLPSYVLEEACITEAFLYYSMIELIDQMYEVFFIILITSSYMI